MSLKCSKAGCSAYELASAEQLAFFQDVNNGGWNLGLGPEFVISETKMPHNIRLVDTSDVRFPYNAICARCMANIGKVNTICGFDKMTVNFSAKHTTLLQSKSSYHQPSGSQKWGKIFNSFPQIRKIVATPRTSEPIVGSATVHFNGLSDLQQMIQFAKAVSERSNLDPRRYQWRSYFFSCLNNTLLCLATGMGKTLIANMLMYAYKQQNPGKGQVFVVPTIVLVSLKLY